MRARWLLVLGALGCSELKQGDWAPDGSVDVPSAVDVRPAADVPVDGVVSCTGNETSCAGRCVDLREDDANCGLCGMRCVALPHCNNGRCRL